MPWQHIVRVWLARVEIIDRYGRDEIAFARTSHFPGLREKIAKLYEEEYQMKTQTKQKAAVALVAGAATVLIGGQVANAASLQNADSAAGAAVVVVSDNVVKPGVVLW
ncbi:hypothetical protein IU470_25775 [Nocardia abscessus]|uniref:Uncharacterized protein n=1 Tax=Nocardia abscessus TaxID=120957 RepID=A0ABS0CDR8_9NOCA|nr:hypothetical protein [Nocardia abscessus]MBF6228503.1 hypothetical protein [Nocardia abscessus]